MERPSNSGYHPCPCRDCFEIAIGCDDDTTPHLCNGCESAGCEADGSADCEVEFEPEDEEDMCIRCNTYRTPRCYCELTS